MTLEKKIRMVWVVLLLSFLTGQARAYQHGMTNITPSEQWREASPAGNGLIGALVYGSIVQERVLFNHNQLWYGGRHDDLPDMSAELPVVRKRI